MVAVPTQRPAVDADVDLGSLRARLDCVVDRQIAVCVTPLELARLLEAADVAIATNDFVAKPGYWVRVPQDVGDRLAAAAARFKP